MGIIVKNKKIRGEIYMKYEFVVRVFHVDEQNIVVIPMFIHKKDHSVWVTLKIMSELFDVNQSEVQRHIKDIFEDGELDRDFSTQRNNNIVLYDLDVLISAGFRINSDSALLFRKWAIKTIKEYIIKGFAVDEELLINS